MKQRGESVIHARGGPAGRIHYGSGFWDDVEREIEALDWRDLAEFLEAEAGPFEPCDQFREELRSELLSLVRRHRSA
jgi:hypothetical protein